MFADIVPSEAIPEGGDEIARAAALVKELQRMGIKLETLQGLVGPEKWIAAIKAQKDISGKVIEGRINAREDKIVLAGDILFGVIEAVATTDKTVPAAVAQKLALVQEAVAIAAKFEDVKPVNSKIADVIEAYRQKVRP